MQGKYSNYLQFTAARLHRAACLRTLGRLVEWEPLVDPEPGYSIVLACNTPLAEMLGANLRLLERQRLDHLRQIFVVFDRPSTQIPIPIEAQIRSEFPGLPLRFIYYTGEQVRVSQSFHRAWVYCWLSWALGVAAARTKYCMLHDFDAMLLDPEVIENRFQEISRRSVQYCGVRNYLGNGVDDQDALRVTFELMFDLEFVRRRFKPIELANTVTWYKGRTVDFDIFLYAQAMAGESCLLPIPEEQMVHPQQMICQFTDLMDKGHFLREDNNNLLMIPYFMLIAGKGDLICRTREELQRLAHENRVGAPSIPFFGVTMDLTKVTAAHVEWLRKQAHRLEKALVGSPRGEVSDYFNALAQVVARRDEGFASSMLAGSIAPGEPSLSVAS